jgi:polysaccharide biosynthesis protein PslJ
MRLPARGITAPMAGPPLELVTTPRRIDAVALLTGYVFLLMAIPSSLVLGALGAAGAPAALLAVALMSWYLVARRHAGLAPAGGRQPVRIAAMVFGCAVVAAYVSANRATLPGLQENGADRALISLAGWFGVLALAADGIDHTDRLRTLLRRIVLGATAMAMLGIAEFVTRTDLTQYVSIPGLTANKQVTDLMNRDGLVRVMSTAAQPLEFATVLAIALPLAIHLARFAPPGRRGRGWLQVAIIAATVPLTVSRTAILGLAVTCIVLLPTWPKRDRRRAYLIVAAAPLLAWLISPSTLTGFGGLFVQTSTSRAGAYSEARPYIAHHPWLGQGFGTFFPQTYFFVDNQYLTWLIETGVIGLVALVALFATGWLTARSARRAAADAQTRDLAQCLAAAVAAAAVCFATYDALSFSIASGLYFLLLGCIGALWRLTRAQARAEPQIWPAP